MQLSRLFLYLLIGFISLSAWGWPQPEFRPPGTVPVVDNFFFDETELSNLHWREYLSWLKRNQGPDTSLHRLAYPDTTVWRNVEGGYTEPMEKTYLHHPAYNDYPVVGVTHAQAKAYCSWRTDRVKEMLAANFGDKPRIMDIAKRLEYRLPTKTEWEMVARLNDVNQTRLRLKKKNAGKPPFNLDYSSQHLTESYMFTAPGRSYLPGTKGVFNMIGNVAEMVEEQGVAKGGSFIHSESEVLSGRDFPYEQQEYWLGFRCVCEILDK